MCCCHPWGLVGFISGHEDVPGQQNGNGSIHIHTYLQASLFPRWSTWVRVAHLWFAKYVKSTKSHTKAFASEDEGGEHWHTARADSGHEGTASDLRGNHTVVTAAPPRSPSGRAVPRRGCTSLEQHEAGAPLTHRSCAASFSARTAGGPPTSSTRMSAWHRTSRVVSRNPLSCCSRSRDQALSQQRGILSPV